MKMLVVNQKINLSILMMTVLLFSVQSVGYSQAVPKVHVIDPDSPPIYWTDFEADKIQRVNLDGSNIEDLVTSGLSGPRGIALDFRMARCIGQSGARIKSKAQTLMVQMSKPSSR